jgi:DNA replication protein DnaC
VRRISFCKHGSSGTGKTHIAQAVPLTACHHGHCGHFTSAATLINELI